MSELIVNPPALRKRVARLAAQGRRDLKVGKTLEDVVTRTFGRGAGDVEAYLMLLELDVTRRDALDVLCTSPAWPGFRERLAQAEDDAFRAFSGPGN